MTAAHGIDHGNSQLDESEVDRIYRSPWSTRKLAKLFSVSHGTIYSIKKKRTWRWLTDEIDKLIKEGQ
jgi:transcriptional regulator of aromatic amino acid metabolism